jgi:transposase
MREPEEIPDEEHERILERVCAIDVAKESGTVCTRMPHESKEGRRVSRVWEVKATTRAIIELGDHLVCQGIEKVTVESTSDYWRIWFYLLEARGLDVQLVNARDVKNAPGRPKTDLLTELSGRSFGRCVRGAAWLARFARRDQRRRRAAGVVRAGGAAAGVARGDRGSVPAVPAR